MNRSKLGGGKNCQIKFFDGTNSEYQPRAKFVAGGTASKNWKKWPLYQIFGCMSKSRKENKVENSKMFEFPLSKREF